MTAPSSDTSSVVARTRPITAGAGVVAVHFLGTTAAVVLGEEAVVMAAPDGSEHRVGIHDGAILSAAADGDRLVAGTDDGRVILIDASGAVRPVAADAKRRWIDHVALGPDDAVAWSAGKTAFVRTTKGDERSLDLRSTPGGLAFAPKGLRLAAAHYGGATLWFPNAVAEPEFLEWKGSHLGVTISPDGRFLVTAMQEPMLHGWRLADRRHMRMSGYAAKVRSFGWTAGGRWLASSGSEQLILWPFHGKDGPMGRTPRMLAPYRSTAVVVACHPADDVVAVGYADGLVLMVRIDDGAEIIAKRAGAAPVSALAWNAKGSMLAFGTDDGEAGVIDLA